MIAVTRLGAGLSLATALAGLVAVATSVTTPPRSGAFCTAGCVTYPYTDVAAFVPRDYWWLYPQSFFVLLALVLMLCLHATVPLAVRTFSSIAVTLAGMAATTLLADYIIQLTVLQPSLHRGETTGLSLFSQYNPHGVFIALENLGYLLLGLALAAVAAAFNAPILLERGLRWVFLAGGVLTTAALPILGVLYGSDLGYRYEVVAIMLTWITLITSGILLARWFGRAALGQGISAVT
ncbi:hypothetical protein BJ973_000264 [Actinoplanes tereljensis]|uniref:DUF4386 family protein n=1 Tax=Paractinoplanes tereljensis TaxID=571912 RepID=A0A919NQR8_9ACTN|nr:hypothetical protein [Actinoplanes tereljensis]GIF23379.1 hypothetical protein Ate02nite_61090 [Actinoplanes tereljensis]